MNNAVHIDSLVMQKINIKTKSFYVFFISLSLIKQHTINILLSLFIKQTQQLKNLSLYYRKFI